MVTWLCSHPRNRANPSSPHPCGLPLYRWEPLQAPPIARNPLTPHLWPHVPHSLFCGPSISIKLQDYIWVNLSHGSDQRCPMSASYLFLKIRVLVVPELDASLSVERPSFDGLEALLVIGAPEMMAIKLGGSIGPFSRGVPPRSLPGKLFWSHFLRGQTFGKLIYKEIPIITNKSQTTLIWCECQHALYKTIVLGHVLFYDTYAF